MKKNKYNFKQSELYTIARLVVAAVNFFLTRFSAFKGKYNAPWVAAQILAIDAAEDLPDEEQRDELHQTRHVQLVVLVQQSLDKFNALRRYIVEVFPENEHEIKIDAAGGSYYAAAANGDFDSCKQMLTRGNQFIIDNTSTLDAAGQNMPAAFPGEFSTLKTNFQTLHIDYLGSESGAELGTEEKIDANNAIYKIITSVNADAQAIFTADNEEAEREQFILEQQLLLVRGAGVAGMRFHVTDAVTETDIAGASILIKPSTELTSDTNGRALKLQLAAATYQVVISKPAYIPQEIEVIVQTGTVKRVNVQLQPV